MKTQIFPIAIAILMAGAMISGCESAEQKQASAQEDVRDAQQEVREAQQNATLAAQKLTHAEEWRVFKTDVDDKITQTENRIAELKVQMKKPGQTRDEAYEKRIDALEQQNKDLRTRMVTYERNPSDWDSFKREFNREMDALAKALNDLTVNNK